MCNFTSYCQPKEYYGVDICIGFAAPATLLCQTCSLVEQTKDNIFETVKDSSDIEYYKKSNTFCCPASDFETMKNHVKEHIAVGEKIHPSVLMILQYADDS